MNEIYNYLNQLLCDLTVAARNLQIIHWNLESDDFIYLHPFYGGIYDTLADQIDITAERVRFMGAFAHGQLESCIKQSELQTIDSLIPYDETGSLLIAKENIDRLNSVCQDLVTICDARQKWALVNDFSPFLSFYEKTLYFINSSIEEEKE